MDTTQDFCLVEDQRMSEGDSQDEAGDEAEQFETDPQRLVARQKQIDYGKNTLGYERYIKAVPKDKRKRLGKAHDPPTPDITQKMSKKTWDGIVKAWRRHLHKFDSTQLDNTPADNSLVTSMQVDSATNPNPSSSVPDAPRATRRGGRSSHNGAGGPAGSGAGGSGGKKQQRNGKGSGQQGKQQQQRRDVAAADAAGGGTTQQQSPVPAELPPQLQWGWASSKHHDMPPARHSRDKDRADAGSGGQGSRGRRGDDGGRGVERAGRAGRQWVQDARSVPYRAAGSSGRTDRGGSRSSNAGSGSGGSKWAAAEVGSRARRASTEQWRRIDQQQPDKQQQQQSDVAAVCEEGADDDWLYYSLSEGEIDPRTELRNSMGQAAASKTRQLTPAKRGSSKGSLDARPLKY